MAISKKRQAVRDEREKQTDIARYVASGCDPKVAAQLGIIPEFLPKGVTEVQKQQAQKVVDAMKLTNKLEDLQEEALRLWKADSKSALTLGKALLKVRDMMRELPRGAFQKWWMKEGLEKNRVMYCIRLAGGKVEAAKERVNESPRAKAINTIKEKLGQLWEAAESGNKEKADKLYGQIVEDLKDRFLSVLKKTEKARGAAA